MPRCFLSITGHHALSFSFPLPLTLVCFPTESPPPQTRPRPPLHPPCPHPSLTTPRRLPTWLLIPNIHILVLRGSAYPAEPCLGYHLVPTTRYLNLHPTLIQRYDPRMVDGRRRRRDEPETRGVTPSRTRVAPDWQAVIVCCGEGLQYWCRLRCRMSRRLRVLDSRSDSGSGLSSQ